MPVTGAVNIPPEKWLPKSDVLVVNPVRITQPSPALIEAVQAWMHQLRMRQWS